MSKPWFVSLIITVVGVAIILVAAFTNQSVKGFAIGAAIAFIGLAFRPRGK